MIDSLQALAGLATVAALIFLWRQVVVANQQRRLDFNKSGVQFVLQIEGQADNIYQTLLSGPTSLIRALYSDEIDANWTDDEINQYWFGRRLFGHIARMAYLIDENPGEFGMTKQQADRFLGLWLAELRLRVKASPIMRRVIENAVESSGWNEHILRHTRKILEEAALNAQLLR